MPPKHKYRSRLAQQVQSKNPPTSTKSTITSSSALLLSNNLNHSSLKRFGTASASAAASVTPMKQREDNIISITFGGISGSGGQEENKSNHHVLSGNLHCSLSLKPTVTTSNTSMTKAPKLPKRFILEQMIPVRHEKGKLFVTNLENGKDEEIDMSLQQYTLKQHQQQKPLSSLSENNNSMSRNKRIKPIPSNYTNNKENDCHVKNELDLITINVMLYTMNAGLVLSDSSSYTDCKRKQLYVLRPKSNKSAILQPLEILAKGEINDDSPSEKGPTHHKRSMGTNGNSDGICVATTDDKVHRKRTKMTEFENTALSTTTTKTEGKKHLTTKESPPIPVPPQNWRTQLSQEEWMMALTHPSPLEDVVKKYHSCLESNKPTPLDWVSKQLPQCCVMMVSSITKNDCETTSNTTIMKDNNDTKNDGSNRNINDSNNNDVVIDKERLSQLLLCKEDDTNIFISPTMISEMARKVMTQLNDGTVHQENNKDETTSSKGTLLRTIQLQVMIRLQLYAMGGSIFLDHYNMEQFIDNDSKKAKKQSSKKKKKKRKREETTSSSPLEKLIQDITDILSTATFLLGFDTSLSSFLEESSVLPKYLNHSIPTVLQEIYDFFEISNPYNQEEDAIGMNEEHVDGNNNNSSSSRVTTNNADREQASLPSCSEQQRTNKATHASPTTHAPSSSPNKNLSLSSSSFSPSSSPFSVKKPENNDSTGTQGKAEEEKNGMTTKIHKKSFQITSNTISNNPLLKGSQQNYVGNHFNTNGISRLAVKVPAAVVGSVNLPPKPRSKPSSSSSSSSPPPQIRTKQYEKAVDRQITTTASTVASSCNDVDHQSSLPPISTATSTRKQSMKTSNGNSSSRSGAVGQAIVTETPSKPLTATATITITKESHKSSFCQTPTKALCFSEDQTPVKKKPKNITSLVGGAVQLHHHQQTPIRKQPKANGSGVSFFDSPLPSSQSQNARLVVQAALAARRKGKSLSFPRSKKKKS